MLDWLILKRSWGWGWGHAQSSVVSKGQPPQLEYTRTQQCGFLFPCRLIREQLLEGDFTVNMRLLQVLVGGARPVSDTGRLGPETETHTVYSGSRLLEHIRFGPELNPGPHRL